MSLLPGVTNQAHPPHQPHHKSQPAPGVDETPPSEASPYEMKSSDKVKAKLTPTTKAFENRSFLHSDTARMIRIMCEFQEPQQRLRDHNIKGTILFFGSARSMKADQFKSTLADLEATAASATTPAEKEAAAEKIVNFRKVEWMCKYADVAEDLANRLTQWSMTNPKLRDFYAKQPDYLTGVVVKEKTVQPLVVCTGGGPGIMEAANKGAASVPGAKSMGMGITLPFEKGLNPYVNPDLAFEFHYFFTRKFWMMYTAKALIVGPGGFGTMDELFELMTLRQTGKIGEMPIVLLGSEFWRTVVNWQALADFGTISQKEVDRLFFADDAESAFNYIASMIGATVNLATPLLTSSSPPAPDKAKMDDGAKPYRLDFPAEPLPAERYKTMGPIAHGSTPMDIQRPVASAPASGRSPTAPPSVREATATDPSA